MKDNEIWELKKIIQEGMEKSHSVPSPETKERLSKLEISQTELSNKVEKMALDVSEIKIHTTYIKEMFGNLPCKDQNKRITELEEYKQKQMGMIAIIGIVAGIIGWVLTPIINWLLSKIKI